MGRGEWDAASSLRLCDVLANWEQAAVVQRGTCCLAEFAQWRIKARNAATKAVKNHVADLAGRKKVSGCTDTWHKGDSEAIRLQHILSRIAVPPAGAGHDAADGSTAVQQLRHQRDQAEAQVQRLSQQLRNAEAQVAELQDAARQHAAELEQAVQLQTAALQQALQLSNTNVAQLELQLAAAHVAMAPKTAADIATQCDASLMQSADQHMQSSIDCSIDGERWDKSEAGLPSCAAADCCTAVRDIQAMTEEGMARMENQQAVAEQRAATTSATMMCSLCLTRESYEAVITNKKELRPAVESGAISPSMQQAWMQLAKIGESAAQTRGRTAIARLKQTPEALNDKIFFAAARGLKGVSSAKVDIVFTCLRDMMDILRKHRGAAPIDWNHPARADILKRKVDTDLLAALA